MQKSNTDAILEWSKWVTGLSLFSATGCVGVLIGKGVPLENILNVKLAISFFLLTIFIAWSIQYVIAIIKGGYSGQFMGISIFKLIERLIKIEFIVFGLSLIFLALWLWHIKPKPNEAERKLPVIEETHKFLNDTMVNLEKVVITSDSMIYIKLKR